MDKAATWWRSEKTGNACDYTGFSNNSSRNTSFRLAFRYPFR
ncbi:hypothetical protein ACETRX_08720 [Labrys portucalensis]|uniref:Uncharacterized protein n=1 Tax=Labrys neptuniae TaxID=376174 RepID=A0ABV3PSR7_9HYPH|nr:hypothetical protein [Labrys neptuniae]MDT3375996.1 hypothetical protein [Labrys neptuniae]